VAAGRCRPSEPHRATGPSESKSAARPRGQDEPDPIPASRRRCRGATRAAVAPPLRRRRFVFGGGRACSGESTMLEVTAASYSTSRARGRHPEASPLPALRRVPLGSGSSRSANGGGYVAKYLGKRFVALVAIVFLVSVGAFYLVTCCPVTRRSPSWTERHGAQQGDPDAQLGLNKPLYEQYFIWRPHLRGQLRQSYVTTRPCSPPWRRRAHRHRADRDLQIIAFAIAIPLALLAAGAQTSAWTATRPPPRSPGSPSRRSSSPAARAHLLRPLHIFPGPASYVPLARALANLNSMILPRSSWPSARSSCTSASCETI